MHSHIKSANGDTILCILNPDLRLPPPAESYHVNLLKVLTELETNKLSSAPLDTFNLREKIRQAEKHAANHRYDLEVIVRPNAKAALLCILSGT